MLGAVAASAAAQPGGGLPGSGGGGRAVVTTSPQTGTSSDSGLGAPSSIGEPPSEDGGSCSGENGPGGGAVAATHNAVQKLGTAKSAAAPAAQASNQQLKARIGPSGASATARATPKQQQHPQPPVFRSNYRGVSYDKKKRKWRVQIKVAALGKSGVSVGYFDTEVAAARAYDRAALGLLGRSSCRAVLNFPAEEYANESVPELVGKTREEVKAMLKSERAKLPKRRPNSQKRTSKFIGVGASNRKSQWQARILVAGKVTHLGYYGTEEEAARVYDRVAVSLSGEAAQTNFPYKEYAAEAVALTKRYGGLSREELQRALGVKPSDRSSRFRGVRQKRGQWEAKVPVNRRWAYREAFASEEDAARAYDAALWRLRPRGAAAAANFGESCCPPDVLEAIRRADKDDQPIPLHSSGLPLTAKPILDGGLLFDEDGASIKESRHRLGRIVSHVELAAIGESAGMSSSSDQGPSSATGPDGSRATGGGAAFSPTDVPNNTAVADATKSEGVAVAAMAGAGVMLGAGRAGAKGGIVDSASFTTLSALDSASAGTTVAGAAAAARMRLGGSPQVNGVTGTMNTGGMMEPAGGLVRAHSTPVLPTMFSNSSPLQQGPHPPTGRLLPQQPGGPMFLGPDAFSSPGPLPPCPPHGAPPLSAGMMPQRLLARVGSENHLMHQQQQHHAALMQRDQQEHQQLLGFSGPVPLHQMHPQEQAVSYGSTSLAGHGHGHPRPLPLGPSDFHPWEAPGQGPLHRAHCAGGFLGGSSFGHSSSSNSALPPSLNSSFTSLGSGGPSMQLGPSQSVVAPLGGTFAAPHRQPPPFGQLAASAGHPLIQKQQQHQQAEAPRPASPLLFAGGGFHIGGEDLDAPLAYLSGQGARPEMMLTDQHL